MSTDKGDSDVVSVPRGDTPGAPHPRQTQFAGGRVVPQLESCSDGVVARAVSVPGHPHQVGSSVGGLVRDKAQQQASAVCLASPRSGGVGDRRAVLVVEASGRVCLSSVHHASQGPGESQTGRGSSDTGGPLLADQTVVLPSTGTPDGAPGSSASLPPTSVTARGPDSPLQRVHAQPSRLEAIRHSVGAEGFSAHAARIISESNRPSTSQCYDAKWRAWSDWCLKQQVDPLDPSLGQVGEFFIHLYEVKNLSVSAIKGYRSAMSSSLKFSKNEASSVGSDPKLSAMIRYFARNRFISRSVTPRWNLTSVLWSLCSAPYEPLGQASLLNLSIKTAFLLAFATAKRRGELHALSCADGHMSFASDSVTFILEPGFLAKSQTLFTTPDPIIVPALPRDCRSPITDRYLCPVRAIKIYLKRTKKLRKNRLRFFIPTLSTREVSKATISRWICRAITTAYAGLSTIPRRRFGTRAHEVRAVATSWAFRSGVPLSRIMQAASWRHHNTFSRFYLRSLTTQAKDLLQLGPLVAAGAVVNA